MSGAGYIPYGVYWSTPFARWQGSLSRFNSIELASHVVKSELGQRNIPPTAFDSAVFGMTVPQLHSFFAGPWLMASIGAVDLGAVWIHEACATSARCLDVANQKVATGAATCVLVVAADRTSNSPQVYYPDPGGPGGAGYLENWVSDNFSLDPYAGGAMIETGERVARKYGIGTEEQHDLVVQRYTQYAAACANDHAFQRKYMTLPFKLPSNGNRAPAELSADEGIHATTKEGLARLKPSVPGGVITPGAQTHPADGNAGIVVASRERAQTMSRRPDIEISIRGVGEARAPKGEMPFAPVPASRRALEAAGMQISDVHAVTSHNPFIVNDLVFARETGFSLDRMNNNGCSLVWGHPQGPTGMRATIELIEELVERGGGNGLFQGCAAGDRGMALVVTVRDARPAAP